MLKKVNNTTINNIKYTILTMYPTVCSVLSFKAKKI